MAVKIGLEAKAYRLTTGTRATWGVADANGLNTGTAPANLDEVGNAADVTINITRATADTSVRANSGWATERATLKRATVDMTLKHDPADPDFAAIMKSWLTGTSIAMAFLDGPSATVGTTGLWADFEVFDANKAEPLEDAQTMRFTLRPASSAVNPEWVKVS